MDRLGRRRTLDGAPVEIVSHSSTKCCNVGIPTYMNCSSSTVQPMLFAKSNASRLYQATGYGSNLCPAPTPLMFTALIPFPRCCKSNRSLQLYRSLRVQREFLKGVTLRGGFEEAKVKFGKLEPRSIRAQLIHPTQNNEGTSFALNGWML